MKAMILAAGLGSRLKEMTQHCPKALVEAGGITLLERCIEKMKSYQVNDFVINIHHFGEQIIQFVEQKHYFNVNIQFSDERTLLLDTGGGIKHARKFLDNGDVFPSIRIIATMCAESFILRTCCRICRRVLPSVGSRSSGLRILFLRPRRLTTCCASSRRIRYILPLWSTNLEVPVVL